ncbi:MAG: CHASE3 domain-containing protein, partial [Acetobacteraceae bacterium]
MRKYFARPAAALPSLAALMVIVGIGLLTWSQFRVTGKARLWVFHTYEVLGTVKDLRIVVRDAEGAQRGYLLTGDEGYLRPDLDPRERLMDMLGTLKRLTVDSPLQEARLQELDSLIQRKLEEIARTIEARRSVGPDAALAIIRTGVGRRLTAQIDTTLAAFGADEQALLDARLAASAHSEAVTAWLSLIGDLSAVGLLGLAFGLLALAQARQRTSEAAQRGLATQLRTSLDSISQGVALFDVDHRLVRWNEPLPLLLGLSHSGLATGTPYAVLESRLAATLMGGLPFLDAEKQFQEAGLRDPRPIVHERVRTSDGRGFEVRRSAMPGGGFVITVADITERTRAEAMMRESQRMQAIGQLTGGIAHDFNNLLAVIMGNLELAMSRMEAGHPTLTRLERAMWGARRGASLTQQLLAFARKQPLAPQPRDLSAMLADLVGLLGRTLGEQVDIQVVDPAGVWPALADAAQVESAVLNLALNARDAMPDGGRLTIEVANVVLDAEYARRHAEVAEGDYVMIGVTDTGTGMTQDVLARAFDPFFTTKDVGKGTGLGLAMVFGFAKQSGGHVEIASEPGEGTTVRLFLPRA